MITIKGKVVEPEGVCFVDFVFAETVYLITVYPKKAKDNLSKEERNEIKKVIEALKKSLGGE